jgi:hypothetical protein
MKKSMLFPTVLYMISVFIYFSCNQKEKCEDIEYFDGSGSENAIARIRSLPFRIIDSVDNPGGGSVRKAYYYSCDGNKGYFIFIVPTGYENFNQGVPKKLWEEFKQSKSKDTFYYDNFFQKYSPKIKMRELLIDTVLN